MPSVPHLSWTSLCSTTEALHLARVQGPQPQHWRLHSHDFYECFVVEDGQGWHVVDGRRLPLRRGDLWFIRPEHQHGLEAAASGLRIANLAWAPPCIPDAMLRYPQTGTLWPADESPQQRRVLGRNLVDLIALIDGGIAGERTRLDADFLLCALLRLLARPSSDLPVGIPEWLREALTSSDERELVEEGVPGLIARCGCSPEHVARTFRQHLGSSPSQWLRERRLELARQLLCSSDASITDIALRCNFDNLSYFHRCFKVAFGCTPATFRARHLRSLRGS